MNASLKKLLWMNVIGSIVFIYIGIFVNLFFWEKTKEISDISFYNMMVYIAWGLSFVLGARLLARFSIRLLLALSGLAGGSAFVLLTVLSLEHKLLAIALVGLPVGMMFGFYQSSLNLSLALHGKSSEFTPFFAATATISQVLTMAVPIVSAQVIRWFSYEGSFVLMLMFLALMLVYSFFMPRISLREALSQRRLEAGSMRFGRVFGTPGARWLLCSFLAGGIFMQFQNLFTLIFTFTVTEDKTLIALLNALYTVCALGGLYLFRRIRLTETRWLWIGALLLSVGFLVALYPVKPMLIVSNVLTAIGMFYFSAVWNAQLYRCIQQDSPSRQTGLLIWRECLLCFTRCVLLVMMSPLQDIRGWLFVCIVLFTLASLLAIPVFQQKALRAYGIGLSQARD